MFPHRITPREPLIPVAYVSPRIHTLPITVIATAAAAANVNNNINEREEPNNNDIDVAGSNNSDDNLSFFSAESHYVNGDGVDGGINGDNSIFYNSSISYVQYLALHGVINNDITGDIHVPLSMTGGNFYTKSEVQNVCRVELNNLAMYFDQAETNRAQLEQATVLNDIILRNLPTLTNENDEVLKWFVFNAINDTDVNRSIYAIYRIPFDHQNPVHPLPFCQRPGDIILKFKTNDMKLRMLTHHDDLIDYMIKMIQIQRNAPLLNMICICDVITEFYRKLHRLSTNLVPLAGYNRVWYYNGKIYKLYLLCIFNN